MGPVCTSVELMAILEEQLQLCFQGDRHKPTPICIWGSHGIGKTALIKSIAERLGAQFCLIAPAQFEEMGDLIGMPHLIEATEGKKTVLAPPEWVPKTKGPGILLIDDVNRADDRILRGIMQLLEDYQLVSWSLPDGWQILLTANPDKGDYSVTPLDQAMLTRMYHFTMKFDVEAWTEWAMDNDIDDRGIQFVWQHPELISGNRTTPRTLVQFFEAIRSITSWKKRLDYIQKIGLSCLDEATVAGFIQYIRLDLAVLPTPADLLLGDGGQALQSLKEKVEGQTIRLDILSGFCYRLLLFIQANHNELTSSAIQNLIQFLKADFIPKDLRFKLMKDLTSLKVKALQSLAKDTELALLLLA